MPDEVYLGFDFGYKRIGMAVGQKITSKASPLMTISANKGVPDWQIVQKIINEWRPHALIVGVPTCIDGSEQYTTKPAQEFAKQLQKKFSLPVYLVDERLSTVEARERLFASGGYKKIQKSAVDSVAACVILEQWLYTDAKNF